MASSVERPWYEGPRTRAQRRRGSRELSAAPWGVTLVALLPLILVASFEVAIWLSRSGELAVRDDILRVLPYVLIIPIAVFAMDRDHPRWSVPWSGFALWGGLVVVREVARRLAAWTSLDATYLSIISGVLLALTVAAGLFIVLRLRRTSPLLATLFVACFLLADLSGIAFKVIGVVGHPTWAPETWWAIGITLVQAVVVALALRWALNGGWPGVWMVVGLVVVSPVLAFLEIQTVPPGALYMTARAAALAWWPVQAVVLALSVGIVFWRPRLRRTREVDTQ